MSARRPVVSVVGSAIGSEDLAHTAEEVGRLLARAGVILVCGGRGGVMEAACRGAHAEGGFTVGILPGTSREEGNRYLSFALATGLGEARNTLVASAGQAVIAVGGGMGTLSEIAFALKRGVQVILLSPSSWDDLLVDEPGVLTATTAEEAVQEALRVGSQRSV